MALAASPLAPPRTASLRASLAVVVATLSLLPNLAVALVVYLQTVRADPNLVGSILGPLAAVVLGVTLTSALVGYVLSRTLLQPLTRLRDELARLETSGQRLETITLPPAGPLPEEVAAVRGAFSSLLAALRAEADKRSAFMATLMHDLKTPIIAANHVLTVVRDQSAIGPVERRHLVSSLLEENARLLALVQKMVDAHRFERERVTLDLAPTDLARFVAGLVERVGPDAAARGLALSWSGAGCALAAPAELERALSNLVDNATRYARGEVRLTVDGPSILVSDDGPGLPAPLAELAQPFNSQQVELAGRRYTSGTGGLGLYIAQQIVLAHGGRLEQEPGPGTTLRVRLEAAP